MKSIGITAKHFVLCLTIIAMGWSSSTLNAQPTKMKLIVNNQTVLTATLVDNSSTAALIELLKKNPITIDMQDYGSFEKVGSLGTTLPRNDEQITTEPGDLILYQGSAFVIYYAPNSWNFTRLGKIDDLTQDELKAVLGTGNVKVKLELDDTSTPTKQMDEEAIKIYPNPVKEKLQLDKSVRLSSILDVNGKVILQSNQQIVDVTGIKPGIYFLKTEDRDGKSSIQKVIKE